MTKYEYILFDADGTLYDFPYAEEHAIQETWSAYKIPINDITLSCFHKHNGVCWKELEEGKIDYDILRRKRFDLMFSELGYAHIDPPQFNEDYIASITKHSKLFVQSLEVLQTLKHRGYKLSIITNGIYTPGKEPFNREETRGIFHSVFYSQKMGVCKPDRRFFEGVFRQLGIDGLGAEERRRRVVVVGDSLTSDIQGGINAGVDTVWYNPGGARASGDVKPTFVVGQLKELLDYFPPLE